MSHRFFSKNGKEDQRDTDQLVCPFDYSITRTATLLWIARRTNNGEILTQKRLDGLRARKWSSFMEIDEMRFLGNIS